MFHNNYIGLIAVLLVGALSYVFVAVWNKKIKSLRLDLGIKPSINRNVRIALLILLIGFIFYLDFLRIYVFQNLTFRMEYQYLIEQGGSPDKYIDGTDSWMKSFLGDASSNAIYKLKYVASALFLLTYGFISILILKLVYPSHNTFPYTLLLYGLGILAMSFVFGFYFFEWSVSMKNKIYLVAMEIGHFLESSLPTLLSILGFKIYLSSHELKSNE